MRAQKVLRPRWKGPKLGLAFSQCGVSSRFSESLKSLYASALYCSCPAVERYDPRTNRWSSIASMGTRRKHLGCAVYSNMIYAVGGRDDTTELSSAERYNPQLNQWQPIVAMTSRRSGVRCQRFLSFFDSAPALHFKLPFALLHSGIFCSSLDKHACTTFIGTRAHSPILPTSWPQKVVP